MPGAVEVRSSQEVEVNERKHDSADTSPESDVPYFSLAGMQLKFSALKQHEVGVTIPAHGLGGEWIVKPPSTYHKRVPQNEYSVMSMAAGIGIDVPEIALVPLVEIKGLPAEVADFDEAEAFVIRRFDRNDGQKVHMEDFAQAMGKRPYDKYSQFVDYTDVTRLIDQVCSDADVIDFSRRLMFNAIVGNGDMHLKNWSFVYSDGRAPKLSPAYDFLCTSRYIPNDRLTMTLGSTRKWQELTLDDFTLVANRAGVNQKAFVDAAVDTVVQFRKHWEEFTQSLPVDKELKHCIEHQMNSCPAIVASLRPTPNPKRPRRTRQ